MKDPDLGDLRRPTRILLTFPDWARTAKIHQPGGQATSIPVTLPKTVRSLPPPCICPPPSDNVQITLTAQIGLRTPNSNRVPLVCNGCKNTVGDIKMKGPSVSPPASASAAEAG